VKSSKKRLEKKNSSSVSSHGSLRSGKLFGLKPFKLNSLLSVNNSPTESRRSKRSQSYRKKKLTQNSKEKVIKLTKLHILELPKSKNFSSFSREKRKKLNLKFVRENEDSSGSEESGLDISTFENRMIEVMDSRSRVGDISPRYCE